MHSILTHSLGTALICIGTMAHADTVVLPPGSDIQATIDLMDNGDTIQLEAGSYLPTSPLDTSGKSLTILGAVGKDGEPASILDGQDAIRLFNITGGEGPSTVLENLRIVNGNAMDESAPFAANGGGIYCEASPTIRNCRFISCDSTRGGALYLIDEASPSIVDCRFEENNGFFGGAIYTNTTGGLDVTGDLTIEGCTFSGNTTEFDLVNGIIRFVNPGQRLVLRSCVFKDNNAITSVFTGHDTLIEDCTFRETASIAVECGDGTLEVRDSEFIGTALTAGVVVFEGPLSTVENVLIDDCSFRDFGLHAVNLSASQSGGQILSSTFRNNRSGLTALSLSFNSASWQVEDCIFTGNIPEANINGGAVRGGNISFDGCGFAGNAATVGSAVYGEDLRFNDCFFNENSCGDGGGIVYVSDRILMNDCDFSNNSSQGLGGAITILSTNDESSVVENCQFFRNFARRGGAICTINAEIALDNCDFTRNEATAFQKNNGDGQGGAIYLLQSHDIMITDCTFNENAAAGSGGALHSAASRFQMTDSRLESNQADERGGGVYTDGFGDLRQISGSRILANTSPDGGGVYNIGTSLQIEDSLICGNTVGQVEGDLYVDLGGNTISDSGPCIEIPGDFDGNNVVDGADLAVILGSWGPCTSADCVADLDDNGTVNGGDLALVLANWGTHQ